jgi:hypothetical protein
MSGAGTQAHKLSFSRIMLTAGLVVCLLPVGLSAPAVMGTLHGRITDSSGAPVAKAVIAIISSQGRVKLGASNTRGDYAIHNLNPGLYTVWAAQGDLSLLESAHLGITRGQVEAVDIELSNSRRPPRGLPVSRNSRMELAALERKALTCRRANRDISRNARVAQVRTS